MTEIIILIVKIITVFMITALFIFSGFDKIINFNNVVPSLNSKMIFNSLPLIFSQLAMVMTILLELVSPILILYGVIKKDKRFIIAGLGGLITFTILASIFYHDFSIKDNGFMKNLSIVGALLFIILNI